MRFWSSLILAGTFLAAPAFADDTADLTKGKDAFNLYCASCHGQTGDGMGPVGKALKPAPRDFTIGDFKYGGSDQDIFDVISNGAASRGGSAMMAPWGAVIDEQTRWAMVKYIRSLKK